MRVSKENLIGEGEGEGFSQIMRLFNINRIVAASQGVGIAQGALDKAVKYHCPRAIGKDIEGR